LSWNPVNWFYPKPPPPVPPPVPVDAVQIPALTVPTSSVDEAVSSLPWEAVPLPLPPLDLVPSSMLTGVEYSSVYSALMADSVWGWAMTKYLFMFGWVNDALSVAGIPSYMSCILIVSSMRIAGTFYRAYRMEKNISQDLVRETQNKFSEIMEYQRELGKESPLRDSIGYAYKKPTPLAIKTFFARKGRFVHIVNKELDFDWDKEVDLISAQGPAARTLQHMVGPQIVTSIAFFVASMMSRGYRDLPLEGWTEPFLWFTSVTASMGNEHLVTAGLIGATCSLALVPALRKGNLSKLKLGVISTLSTAVPMIGFSFFDVPPMIQVSVLIGCIGNQFITQSLHNNYFGLRDKTGLKTQEQVNDGILAALRRDPVIGEHMRKKDLEELLEKQRNTKPAEEKKLTFTELYMEERWEGYSVVASAGNAVKRQMDWDPDLTIRDNIQNFMRAQQSEKADLSLLYPYDLPNFSEKKNELARQTEIEKSIFIHRADAERKEYESIGLESYDTEDLQEDLAMSQSDLAAEVKDIERSADLVYEEAGTYAHSPDLPWKQYQARQFKQAEIKEKETPIAEPWWKVQQRRV